MATPKAIIEELYRRLEADDDTAYDELVAEDMINHAAGPQGRQGLRQILTMIGNDLGELELEHHHLVAEGELVAHHMSMHGFHQASTMPLFAGIEPTGAAVTWTFIHLWRVVDGQVVEHWATRDDLGLLHQIAPPQ